MSRFGATAALLGDSECRNIDIVRLLLGILRKPESLITFVKDRPGHDLRYAIDASKIMSELGWAPAVTFEQGLQRTVEWYIKHEPWWRGIISGAYKQYYREMYEER